MEVTGLLTVLFLIVLAHGLGGETVALRNPMATRPWQHVLEPLSGYLALSMSLHESDVLHGEPFNFGPPAQQNHSVGALGRCFGTVWRTI